MVIPGYKHQDYNHDKKIDTEDIRLLIPDAKVRDAYLKTSKDVGWEDKLGKIPIPGTGYKNLDFDLNNRIEQLDLQILFSNKYEDGTLIKRDDRVYVMMGGGKRLIPDEKTFNILGFDHKDEISLSNDEFNLIPDLGSLAPIKYENGSIVKGVDHKLYLMSYGSKIEIPDQTTYEALGLNIADHTITIRAKGKADDNVYPIIQLRIDGEVIKEWFVSSEYKDYTTTVPLSEGEHKIEVVYPNDQDIETVMNSSQRREKSWFGLKEKIFTTYWSSDNVIADRSLVVDCIKIDNETIQAEDTSQVKYDKGISNNFDSFSDEQNAIPGQENLEDAGALRFKHNFKTAISVSNEDLVNIPEGGSLPLVKYPNGTILKDESGKLYLMRMGQRKLIPDKITFEALGFKEDKIISVNSSSLQEIPEDEAIPVIKYPNRTLLRSQEGKVYMINLGIKREIVNNEILKQMVMERVRKDISADCFPTVILYLKLTFPMEHLLKEKHG
ncbi:MAG: carbohydrate-binding domain-containing protein [bacterium]